MTTYTPEELGLVLAEHYTWLENKGKGTRADLHYANLRYANLRYANLTRANLTRADLRYADLTGADLTRADLTGADLRYADLTGANLTRADLRYANLTDADLTRADLTGANLTGANLTRADLTGADLREIRDMEGAHGDLRRVKNIRCDVWDVTYTDALMQIGCQLHTISEWWEFSEEEITSMDPRANTWWQVWKPVLQHIIEISPASAQS